ncbi:hypothetical protein D3C81_2177700 [compost metagenome]
MLGLIWMAERRFQQAVAQAVALQGIEHEGLFVFQGCLRRFEKHFEALTEKVPHRVAQEILKLCQAQRLFLNIGIQQDRRLGVRVILMQ